MHVVPIMYVVAWNFRICYLRFPMVRLPIMYVVRCTISNGKIANYVCCAMQLPHFLLAISNGKIAQKLPIMYVVPCNFRISYLRFQGILVACCATTARDRFKVCCAMLCHFALAISNGKTAKNCQCCMLCHAVPFAFLVPLTPVKPPCANNDKLCHAVPRQRGSCAMLCHLSCLCPSRAFSPLCQ